jgi:hypothetical protein
MIFNYGQGWFDRNKLSITMEKANGMINLLRIRRERREKEENKKKSLDFSER